MNDDFLSQLSSALAEEKQGATAVPAVTRERVMTSLAQSTPKRRLRLAWGMPLLLGLVGSSAWASQQEGMWAWLGEQLGSESEAAHAASGSGPRQEPTSPASSPQATEPQATDQQVAGAVRAPQVTGSQVTEPRVAQAGEFEAASGSAAGLAPSPVTGANAGAAPATKTSAPERLAQASSPGPGRVSAPGPASAPGRAAAEPSPAGAAAKADGLALYRAAHDAQFRSASYATALDGYQKYLREYPAAAFVPEARYNSALCLLNLGRQDEARELLQPFADGAYGGYRSERARELLEAIESR